MIEGLSGADSSVTHTKEEFQKAFQVLFGRVTSQEPINISHFLSVKVSCHCYAGDAELILNVNCKTATEAHSTVTIILYCTYLSKQLVTVEICKLDL